MKYLVIFALISLAAACRIEENLTDGKITEIENSCQTDFGVLNDELKGLIENKPESHNVKCVRACILKRLDVMDFYGRIKKSSAKKTLMFLSKNNTTNEVLGNVIDTCSASEVSSDICEAASENAKCIKRELERRGIALNVV